MSTTMTPPAGVAGTPVADATRQPPSRRAGPLIVATDATESADAAFVAARMLAHRRGLDVNVVAVIERPALMTPAPYPIALPPDLDNTTADRLRDVARRQLSRIVGDAPSWSVETQFGDPALTLRRLAAERKAELVITGVSRHGVVERMFGEETPANIAQATETPMLAATPGLLDLPRTLLVEIDLDSPSIPDSGAVRALVSEATTVYFVNAKPRLPGVAPRPEAWTSQYDAGVQLAYERVRDSLALPPHVYRQLVTLEGTPAKEILSFAAYAKVDLIVVGQRRRWPLHRGFGSALPRRLLRGATCSVLVLPRPRVRSRVETDPSVVNGLHTETITERHRWAPRLAQLSRHSTGRRVMVDIDALDLGAQALATDYPFVAMDYDHHDDRIEIMLGFRTGRTAHLTHSVSAPTSLDILEGADGRAVAVRVANEHGQTLVTFIS
jgi:nucleotide-binding universal stress UspA family protein